MFKQASFENELAESMEILQAEATIKEELIIDNKRMMALYLLNEAAMVFEETGLQKYAQAITIVMEKIAGPRKVYDAPAPKTYVSPATVGDVFEEEPEEPIKPVEIAPGVIKGKSPEAMDVEKANKILSKQPSNLVWRGNTKEISGLTTDEAIKLLRKHYRMVPTSETAEKLSQFYSPEELEKATNEYDAAIEYIQSILNGIPNPSVFQGGVPEWVRQLADMPFSSLKSAFDRHIRLSEKILKPLHQAPVKSEDNDTTVSNAIGILNKYRNMVPTPETQENLLKYYTQEELDRATKEYAAGILYLTSVSELKPISGVFARFGINGIPEWVNKLAKMSYANLTSALTRHLSMSGVSHTDVNALERTVRNLELNRTDQLTSIYREQENTKQTKAERAYIRPRYESKNWKKGDDPEKRFIGWDIELSDGRVFTKYESKKSAIEKAHSVAYDIYISDIPKFKQKSSYERPSDVRMIDPNTGEVIGTIEVEDDEPKVPKAKKKEKTEIEDIAVIPSKTEIEDNAIIPGREYLKPIKEISKKYYSAEIYPPKEDDDKWSVELSDGTTLDFNSRTDAYQRARELAERVNFSDKPKEDFRHNPQTESTESIKKSPYVKKHNKSDKINEANVRPAINSNKWVLELTNGKKSLHPTKERALSVAKELGEKAFVSNIPRDPNKVFKAWVRPLDESKNIWTVKLSDSDVPIMKFKNKQEAINVANLKADRVLLSENPKKSVSSADDENWED